MSKPTNSDQKTIKKPNVIYQTNTGGKIFSAILLVSYFELPLCFDYLLVLVF